MTSCKYLVSIIIPTYNREEFLRESIDSALNQTYPHVEVVVIDDGSVDGTREILRGYGDRIRVCTQERNMGQSAAQNVGIENATGQWLKFHDSDDLLDSDAIENIVSFVDTIDEKDRNKSIILNNRIRDDGLVEDLALASGFNSFDTRQKIPAVLAGLVPMGAFSGHRNVFAKNKFDETLSNYNDFELLLKCATSGVSVWNLGKRVGSLRMHSQQISRQSNRRDANRLRTTIARTALARLSFRDQIWCSIHMMRSDIYGLKMRKWQQIYNALTYMFPAPISIYLADIYMGVIISMSQRFT